MMTIQEIHAKLRERFGDAVAELSTPAAGDPFIVIAREKLLEAAQFLRSEPALGFDYLRLITGIDLGDRFSSVYHLYSYQHQHSLTLHADLPKEDPRVPSLCSVWPAADWLERESFDMVGIVYEGHPELKRILLPLDWEGHPLRKDYKQPQEYHGIKNV